MKKLQALIIAACLALSGQQVSAQSFPGDAPAGTLYGNSGSTSGPSAYLAIQNFTNSIPASRYNVKCDGVTNDTAAIATALAAANGKVLIFPPASTCLTDPQIISGGLVQVGTFSNGSAIITGIPSTVNLAAGQTVAGYTATQTATTAIGSNIVTLNAFWSTAYLSVGMTVTGVGIPAATTITSIDTVSQIHISNNATANGTPSLTFTNSSGISSTIKTVDSSSQVTLNANATGASTQFFQFAPTNVPAAIWAYGTTFKARAGSASPLFTVENPHVLLNGFSIYGAIFDANSLHAYPLKVHGGQFMYFRDIQVLNGTTGGGWWSGEAGYGIYSSLFENVRSRSNVGAGIIAKSINNQGNYLIGADRWIGLDSQVNSTYGMDVDYANIAIDTALLQSNGTCGINMDHIIQFDSFGSHIESNPNNTPGCAITSTANSNNVNVYGGRTIGTTTAGIFGGAVLNGHFNTTGADPAVPISWINGVNFSNGGIGFGGSLGLTNTINGASGIGFATAGTTKMTMLNGLIIGSPTGGDKGNGTLNAATNIYVNNAAVLTANQTITLSSDVTGVGTTAITTTVAAIAGTAVTGTTGTGKVVFDGSPTITTPIFTTSAQTALLQGGTAVGSSLELRATTGVGVGAESVKITTGSNGATPAFFAQRNASASGSSYIGLNNNSPAATVDVRLSATDPIIDQYRSGMTIRTGNGSGSVGMAFINDGGAGVGTSAAIQLVANNITPNLRSGAVMIMTVQDTAAATFSSDYAIQTYAGGTFLTRVYVSKTGGVSIGTTTDAGLGNLLTSKGVQTGTTTVASLPTCNAGAKGQRYFVTDSNAATFHTTVAAGGANNVGVTCDGTNWYIS